MIDEFFLELIFDFDRKSIVGYVIEVKAKRYQEKTSSIQKECFQQLLNYQSVEFIEAPFTFFNTHYHYKRTNFR